MSLNDLRNLVEVDEIDDEQLIINRYRKAAKESDTVDLLKGYITILLMDNATINYEQYSQAIVNELRDRKNNHRL